MTKRECIQIAWKDLTTCAQKVRYETVIDADLDIAKLWLELGRNTVWYKCQFCFCYHLTHGTWVDPYVNGANKRHLVRALCGQFGNKGGSVISREGF